MKKIDFRGRKVLITGASAGIGRALSREFAARGAHLALGSLPGERDVLRDWAAEIGSRHAVRTWTFPIDLLDEDGPGQLYQEVRERVGDIYGLVNNAGTVAYGRFWETPWKRHKATLALNLAVPMQLMHLFLPDMVSRKEGVVLNISSVSALQPTPFQSVYGATKAGLQSLSQGVRAELLKSGVLVCTVTPPYIDTRLLRTEGYPPDLRFYTISGKKSPEWLAARTVKALEKGSLMYIPGFSANIIHNILVRLSPRSVVDAFSRYLMQGRSA